MAKKLKLKKGDKVIVLSGNSKGATGEILKVIKEKDRAIVEGVNMVKKHLKPTAENPQGGIQELEASIHLSNLALVDPKEGTATRVGRKLNEEGKLQRYAKKSNTLI